MLELQEFVRPLDQAAGSLGDTMILLRDLGWDLEANGDLDPDQDWGPIRAALGFMSRIDQLTQAAQTLAEAHTDEQTIEGVAAMADVVIPLISDLGSSGSSLSISPFNRPEFWSDLAEDLFGLLVHRYLQRNYRPVHGTLEFLGILTATPAVRDVPYVQWRVEPGKIPRAFYDLPGLLGEKYHWNGVGGQSFDAMGFLKGLAKLGEGFGGELSFGPVPRSVLDSYYAIGSPYRDSALALGIGVMFLLGDVGLGGLWLVAAPIPELNAPGGDPNGFALFPVVQGSSAATFDLGAQVHAELSGEFSSAGAIRIEILPARLNASIDPSLGASLNASAKLRYGGTSPTFLLGSPTGSRLQIVSAEIETKVFGPVTSPEVAVRMDLTGGKLVIAGGSGDGFLQKLLPPDGIQGTFDLGVDWSSAEGLRFRGSAGLAITIPIHQSFLDAIQLESIYLGVGVESGAILVQVGVSGGAVLGPIQVAVQRIGVSGKLTFPSSGGNLGKANIDVGFLAPTGAGLAIDASGISGGGFLTHDEDLGRYAGILDLRLSDIALVAIGIVSTKLPSGKGFALFINVGVTFSPVITLPYNFNISGFGGLFAYNRSLDVEFLRSSIKAGTLNSLLFPSDPLLNANKIIADSERGFPIHEGRLAVMPMVKGGWGGNGLITFNLGIAIDLPSPAIIAILGQLRARFPKVDDAKVKINLDVLGVLDVAKKSFSMDASIYDSKILVYELFGDAALRLSWQDNPVFALSLGGFHPKFTPPPNFPKLRRLTLQLSSSDKLELSCTVYQALTSNTLQFGSKLSLHAEACGAALDGHLSWDTLIQFSPFEFDISMSGGVSASYKGHDIASISLDLDLSGPTPWHAKGKAKFSVLCWDVKAKFNKTWGSDDKASVAKVDPRPPFLAEVQNISNWNGVVLPRRTAVESLKSAEPGADRPDLLVHPAGALEVRQRLLPLEMYLEKFGTADTKDNFEFSIALAIFDPAATIASPALHFESVKEYFARGQFKSLDKSERLSKPSYEKFKAGVRVGPEIPRIDGIPSPCDLQYDSILIKSDYETVKPDTKPKPKWSKMRRVLKLAQLKRASLRRRGLGKFTHPGASQVGVSDEHFTIVDAETLVRATSIFAADAEPLTQTEAEDLVDDAIAQNRVTAGSVAVVPEYEEATA